VTRHDYDVAIVGYGPVGAYAGLLLAESGLRVAILERSREALELPRAVGLDGESVRSFQRIGLGDEVAGLLQPSREPDLVTFTNSRREPYFGLEISHDFATGWRDVAYFDQPELEAFLRRRVAARDEVDVFMGREVVGLRAGGDSVRLQSEDVDTRAPSELSAAYLLGCDGASSFVRSAIGVEWQSLGYDQDWLVVDILQHPEADLPTTMMQVCAPDRLVTYVPVKDPNRRWEFQLVDGESRDEMVRPERIEALLAPWLPAEHYDLRRAAVYQFHAATAARWREGRVFLAGDAAHQTPPFLGQGLNAGFRDAVNLGWKLPLVLSGVCGEGLLESYAEERDAHARDLVEWAVAVGQLMETFAAREAGRPDPHAADASAGYGQGRTVPPLRDGVLIDDQTKAATPSGSLFLQPVVRGPDGAERRLDDLLGRGFAIVARNSQALSLGGEACSVRDRLGIRAVDLGSLSLVRGQWDRLIDEYDAVVIRPDRYVFGFVDGRWSLDALLIELARKLDLASR
jgi:3-(3-hydroxy-phenyl)propionate hydroxylase